MKVTSISLYYVHEVDCNNMRDCAHMIVTNISSLNTIYINNFEYIKPRISIYNMHFFTLFKQVLYAGNKRKLTCKMQSIFKISTKFNI